MKYKVGTRGSKLALIQTNLVINKLKESYPEDSFEIQIFKTTGDKNQTSSIETLGGKGIFVDTIEQALLNNQIQLAVHSMKDMPETLTKGLAFAKAWSREDARDVLILRKGLGLEQMSNGLTIATCSKRREFQLKQIYHNITTISIRGNIDTRLKKLSEGYSNGVKIDGIILAAAGLIRIGRQNEITHYFSVDEIIPSPAQGTLAIELNENNKELITKINNLSDDTNNNLTTLERNFLKKIGVDCHQPVGAYASIEDDKICFRAFLGDESGIRLAKTKIISDTYDEIVDRAINNLMEQI